jgi:hypothetical protein
MRQTQLAAWTDNFLPNNLLTTSYGRFATNWPFFLALRDHPQFPMSLETSKKNYLPPFVRSIIHAHLAEAFL